MPGLSSGNTKAPSGPVVAWRRSLVAEFFSSTETPGTTAPLESVTTPDRLAAKVCPKQGFARGPDRIIPRTTAGMIFPHARLPWLADVPMGGLLRRNLMKSIRPNARRNKSDEDE